MIKYILHGIHINTPKGKSNESMPDHIFGGMSKHRKFHSAVAGTLNNFTQSLN